MTAIIEISTLTNMGKLATSIVSLAGAVAALKKLPYTPLIALNWSMSFTNILAFTTDSKVAPAAVKIA